MSDSAVKTGQSVLKKITYESGKLCRVATRQLKLSSIRRQRKHYFQNLGERLYIFKVLQKEDNVWEKDEISQLLLTLSDLDQEQELLLQEINEIKAEEMAAEGETCADNVTAPEKNETAEKVEVVPETGNKAEGEEKPAAKNDAVTVPAGKPVSKKATSRKTATKRTTSAAKKPKTATPKAPRKRAAAKTTASENTENEEK